MGINPYHLMYIIKYPIFNFIKQENIKYKGMLLDCENLSRAIDEAIETGKIKEKELVQHIFTWLYQGRKKILVRYFDVNDLKDIQESSRFDEIISNSIHYSNSVKGIENLRLSDNNCELIDKRVYINSADNNKIDKAVLVFNQIVDHEKRGKFVTAKERIPLPVFVTVDFINNEITSRVCTKTDLYMLSGDKTDDLSIAKTILERVIAVLQLPIEVSEECINKIKQTVFNIHDEVTKLPKEILEKGESITADINKFIDAVDEKISIVENDISKEELCNNIKNVILKEIISFYDDKELFEEGKYAISTGIDARGHSLSKLQYKAPADEPVQSNPEYQNIRNVLSDADTIRKNVLLWKSVVLADEKIRSKIYIDESGYGVISLEQYVLEGDIENVLSKIREFMHS